MTGSTDSVSWSDTVERVAMATKKSNDAKPMKKLATATDYRKRPEEDRRAHQAVRLANTMRLQELLLGHGKFNVKGLAAELECLGEDGPPLPGRAGDCWCTVVLR